MVQIAFETDGVQHALSCFGCIHVHGARTGKVERDQNGSRVIRRSTSASGYLTKALSKLGSARESEAITSVTFECERSTR